MDVSEALSFTNETVLLWVAVTLAVFFLTALVLDRLRRGKRRRRRLFDPPGQREATGNLLSRLRGLRDELKQMREQRAQRNRRRGRRRRPESGLR
jgi:hypothetical protein